ncbi:MAG: HAD hydrolase family protein [Acholeplasmatales bacterium]
MLIMLDLDGTLLNNQSLISKESKEYLKRPPR